MKGRPYLRKISFGTRETVVPYENFVFFHSCLNPAIEYVYKGIFEGKDKETSKNGIKPNRPKIMQKRNKR